MKLSVLAAIIALSVTPALAQTDMSAQPPGATDGKARHKSRPHKKKVKKHHARASHPAIPSDCKHTVKTTDTQKAQPCT
ncbi:hypothetical protein WDZ92_36090 [Nostoc sp. NIES-2111]